MSAERLAYAIDLLEADAPLPGPTRQWLRDCLQSILAGTDPMTALGLEVRAARAERNAIIKDHAPTLAWSHSGQARILAAEARRLHRGRRSELPWLARADRLYRLPESERAYHFILKR